MPLTATVVSIYKKQLLSGALRAIAGWTDGPNCDGSGTYAINYNDPVTFADHTDVTFIKNQGLAGEETLLAISSTVSPAQSIVYDVPLWTVPLVVGDTVHFSVGPLTNYRDTSVDTEVVNGFSGYITSYPAEVTITDDRAVINGLGVNFTRILVNLDTGAKEGFAYTVNYRIENYISGRVRPRVGSVVGAQVFADGDYVETLVVASEGDLPDFQAMSGGPHVFDITNYSVTRATIVAPQELELINCLSLLPAVTFASRSSAQYANDISATTYPLVQTVPGSGGVIFTSADGVEMLIDEHGFFSGETGYSDLAILDTGSIRTLIVDKGPPNNNTALNATVAHPSAAPSSNLALDDQMSWGNLIKYQSGFYSTMIANGVTLRVKMFEVLCTTQAPQGGRPELYIQNVADTLNLYTNTVLVEGVRSYYTFVLATDANGTGRRDEFNQPAPQISYDAGNYHSFNLLDYLDEFIFVGGRYQDLDINGVGTGDLQLHIATQSIGAGAPGNNAPTSRFITVEASPYITALSQKQQATHGFFERLEIGVQPPATLGAGFGVNSFYDHTNVAIDANFATMLAAYPDWVKS